MVLSESGYQEMVYNDFYIGEGCDVTIIAGCGIHNCGVDTSKHDGVHTFYVGKNAKVRYVEKHYGDGDGAGERIMNPVTVVYCEENACLEIETTQIKGIDSTNRVTKGELKAGASLEVHEKLMTHGSQYARTEFKRGRLQRKCDIPFRSKRHIKAGILFQNKRKCSMYRAQ